MTIRVLITGSREFQDRAKVAAALTQVFREHGGQPLTVIHGAARGADRLSGAIARKYPEHMTEEQHVVTDWGDKHLGTFDPSAGHRRNQRMVDAGAVVCLAFLSHQSANSGTRSCMAKAKSAGIPVREHWDEPITG